MHTCPILELEQYVYEMIGKEMVTGITLDHNYSSIGQCSSCEYGKATRMPLGRSVILAELKSSARRFISMFEVLCQSRFLAGGAIIAPSLMITHTIYKVTSCL